MEEISFALTTKRSLKEAITQISDLLTAEDVRFRVESNSIRSTWMPIPIWSFDKRFRTRRNWVGINPFIFISGINFFLKESNPEQTEIDITINRRRGIAAFLLFIGLLWSLTISALLDGPAPPAILIILPSADVILPILGYLFIFKLCIKRLIKSEIIKAVS
jgi:hypothetical protein